MHETKIKSNRFIRLIGLPDDGPGRSETCWSYWFLGAFVKLLKATIFVVSSCPSVPHGTTRLQMDGFLWNLISEYYRNYVANIQILLKQDINVTLREDQYTFIFISRSILLRMRNFSDRSDRKNKTCFVLFFENRAVPETMWKNTVESGRPQMTIWRMLITCWITKATNTHSQYVRVILFHYNNGLRTRLNVTLYVYCLVTLL
jgi:hypothetical protein